MNKVDMTVGKPSTILRKLALPIVASNFVQTAFGMINMVWIGRLGSGAVSAIGTASFFLNLATAFSTLIVIGAGVRIAQSIGARKDFEVKQYIKTSLGMSVVVSLFFTILVAFFSKELLGFFELSDPVILDMASSYLLYSLLGVPFLFLSLTLTSILTSHGDTKASFQANTLALIFNIVVDPIFIFGFGIFPAFGVNGAAITTVLARLLSVLLLSYKAKNYLLASIKVNMSKEKMMEIARIGLPITIQRVLFILISMVMAKIIIRFGTQAIAVQKIGIQIESISYMTIGGIQGAIAAYVGQNYGAKKLDRISSGYRSALQLVLMFGTLISILFVVFPKQLFYLFIQDPQVVEGGVVYMQTLGYSQLFMCLELLSVGAFNGIGKTYVPPIISIVLSALRIPLALYLSEFMGLEGIWWSISITSVWKGMVLTIAFLWTMKKKTREERKVLL